MKIFFSEKRPVYYFNLDQIRKCHLDDILQTQAREVIADYDSWVGNAPTGFSIAHPSGNLDSKGIEHVVFTNVTAKDMSLDT